MVVVGAVVAEPRRPGLPAPWIGHLLVFGLLFAMVLAWFFLQTRQAQRVFLEDASEHSRLLADAVVLHTRGARLAEEATETILTGFLESSARFVGYLDGIAPFRADELAAFAQEAGLSMIRIQRPDGIVQGPEDGHANLPLDCSQLGRLIRLESAHQILLGVPSQAGEGCILVGMGSRQIEALEQAIGVSRALQAVQELPAVLKVKLVEGAAGGDGAAAEGEPPSVALRQTRQGETIAQATAMIDGSLLLLDLDAGPLLAMRERLWWEFLGFVVMLALSGVLGAWLLYHHQRAHERQLLDYERRLSVQREEAGLGRAAAAIAHEIRNPLNAMAMGLQRLQLEADGLNSEHRRLVALLREAVQRTNGTVTGLLDFARPVQPRRLPVALNALVEDQLSLYQARILDSGIALELDLPSDLWVDGDPDLLRQVVDNLLRNALESVSSGECIQVQGAREAGQVLLSLSNPGLSAEVSDVERLSEPWFTTKPTGTGLGLAICKRILRAHDGDLRLRVPRPGWLTAEVWMPMPANG
nr:ATP-binding protein [Thiorhodococcus mannitoliphagus]